MITNSSSNSYKAAGVDITAGYKAVELMKKHIARTEIPGVMGQVGAGRVGGVVEMGAGPACAQVRRCAAARGPE